MSTIGPVTWQLGLGDYVSAISVAPDGRHAAVGSLAGDAALIDVADGSVITKLDEHPFGVAAAAWSRDATTVAIGGHDGQVRLYDTDGNARSSVTTAGWASSLAWSPTDDLLAVGAGRTMQLVDDTGAVVRAHDPVASTVTAVTWSPNGKRVGVAAYGGVAWYDPERDRSDPTRFSAWKGSLLSLALAPNGRWACAGSQDRSIHIWRLWSGDELSMAGYPAKVEHIGFRDDGRWMATACLGNLAVWEFPSRGPGGSAPATATVREQTIESLAWEPGGDRLVTGDADGHVILWPSPRRQGATLRPHDVADSGAGVAHVEWSADGGALIIGRDDGTVEARGVSK
ncbi:MAG: hypothetical protein AAFY28_15630 [Actinomycetota bacterium]